MRRTIWTWIAIAGLACAQEASTAQKPTMVQKLIELKYVDPDRVRNLLNLPGVAMHADGTLHAISVWGTSEAVAAVEEMIKKIDVAPQNIELTVYLVSGSAQAPEDVPKDLASTVKQLHALFPYKGYHVLESFVLRNREGRQAGTSGTLPGMNSSYSFDYRSATISPGTPRMVHLDGMMLNVSTPTSFRDKDGKPVTRNSTIRTEVDMGEGQKVVVGKSNVAGSEDALILVLTAKVVE